MFNHNLTRPASQAFPISGVMDHGSLRESINEKCKSCIYDPLSMGTWRQQVSLCSVKLCELWKVRPKTTHPIPKQVGLCYGAKFSSSQESEDELEESSKQNKTGGVGV